VQRCPDSLTEAGNVQRGKRFVTSDIALQMTAKHNGMHAPPRQVARGSRACQQSTWRASAPGWARVLVSRHGAVSLKPLVDVRGLLEGIPPYAVDGAPVQRMQCCWNSAPGFLHPLWVEHQSSACNAVGIVPRAPGRVNPTVMSRCGCGGVKATPNRLPGLNFTVI
jgi:hypothetical protein